MYRIFILSLLAIVFATFALEPSQIILRATEIRGDSIVLQWSPIEGSETYKVFYDEQSLVNPKAPEPILESSTTRETRIEISEMLEGAEYYFVARGYDDTGMEVGETLPLHASTLNIPVFALRDAKVIDDQHIVLSFSRPVDIAKTQIEVTHTETEDILTLAGMTSSTQDLRIITLTLLGRLDSDVPYDIILKNVTNTAGLTLPVESSKKTTVTFSSQEDSADSSETLAPDEDLPLTGEISDTVEGSDRELEPDIALADIENRTEALDIPMSDIVSEDLSLLPLDSDEDTQELVPPDSLPRTGASPFLVLAIAIMLGLALSYRKKISLT